MNNRAEPIHSGIRICPVLLFLLSVDPAHAGNASWNPPKTEYGQPDLQGIWDYGTLTPLQRPMNLAEKRAYTEEEALTFEGKARDANLKLDERVDLSKGAPMAGTFIGQEADSDAMERRHDLTRVSGEYRTSIIIDPPNGRLPVRKGFVDFLGQVSAHGLGMNDGPDTMDTATRCLAALPVPTVYPMPWNANLQIVQTKDRVVLMTEMTHDARIVRLNGEHLDRRIRFWMGDSIGHYEGDTLVVHTVNFRPEQSYSFLMPLSDDFELTERFTRVSDDEILYSFTGVDLKAYTAPFTGERMLKRMPLGTRIFEFACHEGNYSMEGVLAGARKQEFDASQKAKSSSP